jgi:phosphoesterase RecJ-like protein
VHNSPTSPAADSRVAVVDWPRFVRLIASHQHFLLTTHIRPDADAVGSTIAMAGILERLGKRVQIVTSYELPPNLKFLDPAKKFRRLGTDVTLGQLNAIDALMVLDTSAWAQLRGMEEVLRTTKAQKFVLDHHVSSDDLGAELFKNTSAEATGRIVFEAAGHLGVAIDAELARPIFAALATDTGWFRFGSVTGNSYRVAGQLCDAGAVPHAIFQDLYENDRLGRLHLMGRALARAETDLAGRLIWTWLTLDDFAQSGAIPSDSEDIINALLTVGGTQAAVILVEQAQGGFKISFRSRCAMDSSRVAEQFGGGGHRAAAGAFLAEPLEDARRKVLDAVRAAMQ